MSKVETNYNIDYFDKEDNWLEEDRGWDTLDAAHLQAESALRQNPDRAYAEILRVRTNKTDRIKLLAVSEVLE